MARNIMARNMTRNNPPSQKRLPNPVLTPENKKLAEFYFASRQKMRVHRTWADAIAHDAHRTTFRN